MPEIPKTNLRNFTSTQIRSEGGRERETHRYSDQIRGRERAQRERALPVRPGARAGLRRARPGARIGLRRARPGAHDGLGLSPACVVRGLWLAPAWGSRRPWSCAAYGSRKPGSPISIFSLFLFLVFFFFFFSLMFWCFL